MKKIILALTIMLSTVASATGTPQSNASASASAFASAGAIAMSRQTQGQFQVVNINADFSSEETNSGTSGNMPIISSSYENYTPPAYAPPANSTAPCYVGVSAGVGITGFSGSIGAFKYDEECEKRETIRLAQNSDNLEVRRLANEVLISKLKSFLKEEEPKKEEKCPSWDMSCKFDN